MKYTYQTGHIACSKSDCSATSPHPLNKPAPEPKASSPLSRWHRQKQRPLARRLPLLCGRPEERSNTVAAPRLETYQLDVRPHPRLKDLCSATSQLPALQPPPAALIARLATEAPGLSRAMPWPAQRAHRGLATPKRADPRRARLASKTAAAAGDRANRCWCHDRCPNGCLTPYMPKSVCVHGWTIQLCWAHTEPHLLATPTWSGMRDDLEHPGPLLVRIGNDPKRAGRASFGLRGNSYLKRSRPVPTKLMIGRLL